MGPSRIIKSALRNAILAADKRLGLRALLREGNEQQHPLAGDRAIEWSWVTAHLPQKPGRVLDVGCVGSALSGIAARLGHEVVALDLGERAGRTLEALRQGGGVVDSGIGPPLCPGVVPAEASAVNRPALEAFRAP
jgi:hypothetical protein